MTNRAEQLAATLTKATDEAIRAVESCAEGRWRETNADGTWTVAATVHHIAASLPMTVAAVQTVAIGQPFAAFTDDVAFRSGMDQVHAQNEVDAARFAACDRGETLELLRTNAAAAAAFLRGLSAADLDRSAPMAFLGGRETSAAEFADMAVIGHVQVHLASILTTA